MLGKIADILQNGKRFFDDLPWGLKVAMGTIVTGGVTVIIVKRLRAKPR